MVYEINENGISIVSFYDLKDFLTNCNMKWESTEYKKKFYNYLKNNNDGANIKEIFIFDEMYNIKINTLVFSLEDTIPSFNINVLSFLYNIYKTDNLLNNSNENNSINFYIMIDELKIDFCIVIKDFYNKFKNYVRTMEHKERIEKYDKIIDAINYLPEWSISGEEYNKAKNNFIKLSHNI